MSLRARFFLIFALAVTAGIVAVAVWLRADMLPRYMEAQEDTIADTAHVLATQVAANALVRHGGEIVASPALLADTFAPMHTRSVRARISSLLKTDIGLRIYVTDRRGVVIYDSEGGRDVGADYSRWRDVYHALRDEYGARTTKGDFLYPEGHSMYVSVPIYHGDRIVGALGVGKSTRNAERFIVAAVERLALISAGVLLTALLLGAMLHRWLSRPLERLHAYAVALRSGRREATPRLGNDDVGRIGDAMTELRDALDGKQYVEQYVQSLAHELKSPTAAIAGAAELLDEHMPASDRARFVHNIRRESQRVNDIVRRVLELASLEAQQGLKTIEAVSVSAVIEAAIAEQSVQAEARQVRVLVENDASLTVRGDSFLLHRALSNLLANAIDFSPEGAAVTVAARQQGQRVYITIRDHGPGIPGYARDRIFERFYSLPRTDGRKSTGLGLAFVAEIMALHGGSVVLDGDAQGTTATVELPVDPLR